jgi:hypothetical protein
VRLGYARRVSLQISFPAPAPNAFHSFALVLSRIEMSSEASPDMEAVHAALPREILQEPAKTLDGIGATKPMHKKSCALDRAGRPRGTGSGR